MDLPNLATDHFRHTLPVEVIEQVVKWLGWVAADMTIQ